MTWQCHNIFVSYNESALSALMNEPGLRDELYHVTDLEGHHWHSRRVKHGLPAEGILVAQLETLGWGEDPRFLYEAADYPEEREIVPRSELPRCRNLAIGTELSEDHLPPDSFCRYLMHLSRSTMSKVLFYHLLTHGGDRETEYAYAFTPQQHIYLPSDSEHIYVLTNEEPVEERKEDLLVAALRHVAIYLPTGYFALHTRGFPWEQFRV